jgi:hypothetical protein
MSLALAERAAGIRRVLTELIGILAALLIFTSWATPAQGCALGGHVQERLLRNDRFRQLQTVGVTVQVPGRMNIPAGAEAGPGGVVLPND